MIWGKPTILGNPHLVISPVLISHPFFWSCQKHSSNSGYMRFNRVLDLWESFSYTLRGAKIFFFSFWFTFYYHKDFHPSECFSFGSAFYVHSSFHFIFIWSSSLRLVFIWVFFLFIIVFFISKWCSYVYHAWCSLFLSQIQTSECAIFLATPRI